MAMFCNLLQFRSCSDRGRRGGSGMGFSHRGGSGSRRQHYQEQNQNNLQPGQESYQTNNANEFGVQKSHHVIWNLMACFNTCGIENFKRMFLERVAYTQNKA